jgi:hypothetical protein
MAKDWQELTKMTGDEPLVIERIRLINKEIVIEGSFELPPMAKLTMEDQIFAAAFVKSHGSIKDMERLFGVSYPTIKSRLNKIADLLDFVDVERVNGFKEFSGDDTLDRLEQGEISAKEALELLKKRTNK